MGSIDVTKVCQILKIKITGVDKLIRLGHLNVVGYEDSQILKDGEIVPVRLRLFDEEQVRMLNSKEAKSIVGSKVVNHTNWTTYNNVASQDTPNLIGKTVCITGTFGMDRKQIAKMLEDNGVVVKKTVVKSLDYLIAGVDGGSKVVKAQQNNIPIIGKEGLESFLNVNLGNVIKR